MSIESERYEKRTQKARLAKTSCMNNAKWRKLFNAIEVSEKYIFPAEVKLLAEDKTYPFSMNQGISPSGEYTKDSAIQGPIAFKDIEWLYIPAQQEIERYNRDEKLQSEFIKYDIGKLKELIDSLGKYEYCFDENGLKIYGYK